MERWLQLDAGLGVMSREDRDSGSTETWIKKTNGAGEGKLSQTNLRNRANAHGGEESPLHFPRICLPAAPAHTHSKPSGRQTSHPPTGQQADPRVHFTVSLSGNAEVGGHLVVKTTLLSILLMETTSHTAKVQLLSPYSALRMCVYIYIIRIYGLPWKFR